MTDKTIASKNGQPAKMEGWFSWRHPNRDAHEAAVERYQSDRGPDARRRKAAARATLAIDVRRHECGHRSALDNHPCGVTA